MSRFDTSPGDGGVQAWRVPPPSRPCGFCRQDVGEGTPTTCRRCAAVYHPDCWEANERRCAVYGCGAVPRPPVVRPPAIPAPQPASGGFRLSGGLIAGIVIVLINIARFGLQSPSHRTPYVPPRIPEFRIPEIRPPQPIVPPEFIFETDGSSTLSNPRNAQAYVSRGMDRKRQGQLSGALADYNRALAIDPRCAAAYHLRGHLREDVNEPESAIADYTEAYTLDSSDPEPLYDRACTRYDLRDWTESLNDFWRSAEKGPLTRDYARIRICLLRMRLGTIEAAQTQLVQYLRVRSPLRNSGEEWVVEMLKFVSGESTEVEFLLRALTGDPESARARSCQAYYYTGTMRLLRGDRAGAIEHFQLCRETRMSGYREYASAMAELEDLRSPR